MGKLYIVPTPIGNLKDMTFRAIEVLKTVDLILAEDTRTSGKLLKHFEINTPLQSHHMHNEHKTVEGFCCQGLALNTELRWIVYPEQQLLFLRWSIAGCQTTNLFLKVFCQLKKEGKHAFNFCLRNLEP